MNLTGFVQFRLKDYLEILDYLVDLSVNNFIINREYLKMCIRDSFYIYTFFTDGFDFQLIKGIYCNEKSVMVIY